MHTETLVEFESRGNTAWGNSARVFFGGVTGVEGVGSECPAAARNARGRVGRGCCNKTGQTLLGMMRELCSKQFRIQQLFISKTSKLLLQASFYFESS